MAIQQCACTIGLSIEFAAANETICCNFEVPVAAIQHAQDAAAAFIASTVMAVKKGMDAEKREAVAKRAAIEKERALKRKRVEEVVGTGTQTRPPPHRQRDRRVVQATGSRPSLSHGWTRRMDIMSTVCKSAVKCLCNEHWRDSQSVRTSLSSDYECITERLRLMVMGRWRV